MVKEIEQPLVSIILPTYNRSTLLPRSMESVLRQTEQRLELIVVDDASTDETEKVVRAVHDPRLRYVRQETNGGPGAARNRGVDHARAPLVAFQDSDDEWMPDKLKKQLASLEAAGPTVGVVLCDMLRVRACGETAYHRTPDIVRGRLLNPNTGFYQSFAAGMQSALIRRDLYMRVGGVDPDMRWFEDSELFLRLAGAADFRRVPEALVKYYETDGLVTNHGAEIEGRRRTLKRHLRTLLHERPSFVAREALVLGIKSLLGQRAANLRGRPYGPEPS